MKYIEEFRKKASIQEAAAKIKAILPGQRINIMEVCGTHTQAFYRFGLSRLLHRQLNFISGPGCPVCVSAQSYIDTAIHLAADTNNIIATFGDLLRVPGSASSLEKCRAHGRQVQVVYSPLDSLRIARLSPKKNVIFLAVGFETTAPAVALSILAAKKEKIKNLSFFCALKTMPAVMSALLQDKNLKIDGFLCPGHVSTIIGTRPYEFIPKKYGIGCCIAGFEPLDILEGVYFLVRQKLKNKPAVENQYIRVVRKEGNPRAQQVMRMVFSSCGAYWRGLGWVSRSGLRVKGKFSAYDAQRRFKIRNQPEMSSGQQKKCKCTDVLKGLISPSACPLFSRVCTPEHPVGPCMVSGEGACNAAYKYR